MTVDVLTVVGARPQFVKAAIVSSALQRAGLAESLVHTGQHYDDNMSDVFFRELGLSGATRNLDIGGLSHGAMTGRMIEAIESIVQERSPAAVLVYGDTNSTAAAAIAAVKLHVPVAHVEAGMRSFNRRMPEEVNRVITDHVATYHFVTGETPKRHLSAEGIIEEVHVVGDVMRDACDRFLSVARERNTISNHRFMSEPFGLVTLHRPENTDEVAKLSALVAGLSHVSSELPLVVPLHPRTKCKLSEFGLSFPASVHVIEPVGYLDMLALLYRCSVVITDSGGVQKEAFYLGRPCVTAREETEWVETVELGWNRLIGADPAKMLSACQEFLKSPPSQSRDGVYGDGHAAEKIAEILVNALGA
jgi:UDP-N-acetylglucosamine 2-epimerase